MKFWCFWSHGNPVTGYLFKCLFFPQAHMLDPKHINENIFTSILCTILTFPIKDLGIWYIGKIT